MNIGWKDERWGYFLQEVPRVSPEKWIQEEEIRLKEEQENGSPNDQHKDNQTEEIKIQHFSITNIPKTYPNIKYYSIVRHPIIRSISEFYWWSNPEHYDSKNTKCVEAWPDEICSDKKNFTNWVKNPANTAHNRQAKSFYPDESDLPSGKLDFCANFNGNFDKKHFGEIGYDNGNLEFLKEILKNIEENFFFIGLTEKFGESKEIAKYSLAYPEKELMNGTIIAKRFLTKKVEETVRHKGDKLKSHNTAGSRPRSFSMQLLNEIRERNRLDMLMYNYLEGKLMKSLEYYSSDQQAKI